MTNYKTLITNEDKLLAALAYLLFFPALYIALSEKRKSAFLSFAAAQSIILWICYLLIFIIIRILLDLLWLVLYIPAINWLAAILKFSMVAGAIYLSYKSLYGQNYRIPLLSALSDKIC